MRVLVDPAAVEEDVPPPDEVEVVGEHLAVADRAGGDVHVVGQVLDFGLNGENLQLGSIKLKMYVLIDLQFFPRFSEYSGYVVH